MKQTIKRREGSALNRLAEAVYNDLKMCGHKHSVRKHMGIHNALDVEIYDVMGILWTAGKLDGKGRAV